MMRPWAAGFALIVLVTVAPAAPAVPETFERLADRALAVPPEFGADILLQIVDHPDVRDREWKARIIEDAFALAANAQNPLPRVGGIHTDTRESRQAWDLKLDALSLQSRAVIAMLALSKPRARALFERIRVPEPLAPECRDPLGSDVSVYYRTLLRVVEAAYTPAERGDGRDVEALEEQIRMVRAPEHVLGLVKVLLAAPIAPPERARLLAALAGTLPGLHATARQFSIIEYAMGGLLFQVNDSHADSLAWLSPVHEYLVHQYSGTRCADGTPADKIPAAVETFNAFVARLKDPPVHPIEIASIRPESVGGRREVTEFWRTPHAAKLLEGIRWLNHGNRGLTGPERFWAEEERRSPVWEAKRQEVLKLLDDWSDDTSDPASVFHMKVGTCVALAELMPQSEARDTEIARALMILGQYYETIANHAEWFSALDLFRSGMRDKKAEGRLIAKMKADSNPVISLYGEWLSLRPVGR